METNLQQNQNQNQQPNSFDQAEFNQWYQNGPSSFAGWNKKVMKSEAEKLQDKINKLMEQNQFMVDNADSDIEANYIAKPSHTHDEYDIMLGRLNPESRKKSDKYDRNLQQIGIYQNEMNNLAKAQELISSMSNNSSLSQQPVNYGGY